MDFSESWIYKNILNVITELSSMMNSVDSSEFLLESFLNKCIEITEADTGSIMLLDEERQLLVPVVAIGLDRTSDKMFLKVGAGVTGWVAKYKKPRIIKNAYLEKDYVRVRSDLVSEIAVPMLENDKVIGVLSLDSRREGAFTEKDAIFLQIVANLSLAIFKKIKDNEYLKLRERFHRTLLEISTTITKYRYLEDVFEAIWNHTQKVLKVYRSTLLLYDHREKVLKVKATYGFLDHEETRDVTYQPGEGITGKVFLEKKPVYIPSARKEPNFLNRLKLVSEEQDLSFFAFPVTSNQETAGVFSIFTHVQEENIVEIMEFLQILTSFISQAITIQKLIDEEKQPFIEENMRLRLELSKKFKYGNIIWKSPKMEKILQQLPLIANSRSSVLIVGESGTGKELIASAIHFNSPRKDMPFIKINCAAIPETLLESELFGYKKGAFTGAVSDKKGKLELADGGTVFLDEIGEMHVSIQAKLLRVLQEREIEPIGGKPQKVDIRIIAATNADLEERIQQKLFRADLYYRLNVIRMEIPPLRERKEDIFPLTRYFIEKYAKENKKPEPVLTARALEILESYSWPGNVRELENLIERAVVLNTSGTLGEEDFREILKKNSFLHESLPERVVEDRDLKMFDVDSLLQENGKVYDTVIGEVERNLIMYAMKKNKYRKSKAAKFLGINRNTLDKKIKELNIEF